MIIEIDESKLLYEFNKLVKIYELTNKILDGIQSENHNDINSLDDILQEFYVAKHDVTNCVDSYVLNDIPDILIDYIVLYESFKIKAEVVNKLHEKLI